MKVPRASRRAEYVPAGTVFGVAKSMSSFVAVLRTWIRTRTIVLLSYWLGPIPNRMDIL